MELKKWTSLAMNEKRLTTTRLHRLVTLLSVVADEDYGRLNIGLEFTAILSEWKLRFSRRKTFATEVTEDTELTRR